MTTSKTSAPMFKTLRAAKMAFNKAEKAWKTKQTEGFRARDTYRETLRTVGSIDTAAYEALMATEERCAKEADRLFEKMRTIYEAADAQGYPIDSWHLGHNPTRDLISANID